MSPQQPPAQSIENDNVKDEDVVSEHKNGRELNAKIGCKNDDETMGVEKILEALTDEEREALVDEQMPLRHFRAEKGDFVKAIGKIKKTLQWRKEFGVKKITNCFRDGDKEMKQIIEKENETGKIYIRGYDKDGRALMYMRPARENTGNENNNMRHLVFQLEKAIACSQQRNVQKICLVIDYDGFRLRDSPPLSTSRRTLTILQDHYPERMHCAYVCNPPFVFRTFWALVKPFIDPTTKEKIVFCHGEEGLARIVKDVGEKNVNKLERCAGGKENVRDFDSKEYLALPFTKTFDEDESQ